jgi:WG containing repeat
MLRNRTIILFCLIAFLSSCAKQAGQQGKPTTSPDALFPVEQNKKYGFIDRSGKVVVAPQYDVADDFYEGLASVEIGDKWGYIDPSGKTAISLQFDGPPAKYGYTPQYLMRFSEGLASVKVADKWGYVDKLGKMVISPQFDGAGEFSEGLASVQTGDKQGYVDKTGKIAIPAKYQVANKFSEGLAFVSVKSGWSGFIDQTGKEVIKITPAELTIVFGGLAIDAKGHSFSDGLAMMESICSEPAAFDPTNPMQRPICKSGFIDKAGKWVIKAQYDAAGNFSEGLAPVKIANEWGYIDKTGKTMIEPQFSDATDFHEHLAGVKVGSKHGFIDQTGKLVIEPQFDSAQRFTNGLAFVTIGDKKGYIDTKGKMIYTGTIEKPSPKSN